MTLKVNKSALVERPLKTSAPTGAVLASLGIANSLPLMHGSQGCAAFAKVYLIHHFREPIPLQNTAIDQVAAVMGGDENLLQALELLCKKQAPELIAVLTTGLSEMQGCDVQRLIKEFQQQNPQWHSTAIVAMATPDFVGSMQTGFASAVDAGLLPAAAPRAWPTTRRPTSPTGGSTAMSTSTTASPPRRAPTSTASSPGTAAPNCRCTPSAWPSGRPWRSKTSPPSSPAGNSTPSAPASPA